MLSAFLRNISGKYHFLPRRTIGSLCQLNLIGNRYHSLSQFVAQPLLRHGERVSVSFILIK